MDETWESGELLEKWDDCGVSGVASRNGVMGDSCTRPGVMFMRLHLKLGNSGLMNPSQRPSGANGLFRSLGK